ncbi:dsRBD fold-containing protein [Catellatospora vulcania]|uniref:dsRBD fold-containing protein n=1 Tax=Catellatospora vulcania TaxID=1460450 RepID=UPI0012D3BBF9|nr:dsRBD fold-containing protein [Catellatospora vulcania]
MSTKHWTVDIAIDDDGSGRTRAHALLTTDATPTLRGDGSAARNRFDEDVPEIGDELAAGRALVELGQRLLAQADADLERTPA